MPNFDKLKFTSNGLNMQAGAQAGNQLVFSKIKIGKGNASGNVNGLSDLVTPVLEANIIRGTMSGNAYTVQANITNEGLTDGFYWTEIGLFAKGPDGNEILYSYSCTDEETDYIPSVSDSSYMKRVKIAITVGNASEVKIETTGDTYVDALTFNEHLDEITDKIAEINAQLQDTVMREEFGNVVDDVVSNITELGIEIDNLSTLLEERVSSINGTIGTASIAGIGDGSVKGAISELYRLISEIPKITSGTDEPSGGEDGDVYVMYEE